MSDTPTPSNPADVQAAIARIFDEARDRALALVASQKSLSTPAFDPDWITLGQAANIRNCTEQTMVRHVIENGLGVKTGGRWRVDRRRLNAWMAGLSFQPLDPQTDD
jgi:excisionase family DNA binding protein